MRNREEVQLALEIAQTELQYQAGRLEVARGSSEIEFNHLRALATKYRDAAAVVAEIAGLNGEPTIGPKSYTLKEVVEALGITQGELMYRASQVRYRKHADTYNRVSQIIGKLWGYQKGRLEQQGAEEDGDPASVGFYTEDDDEL